MTYWRAVEGTPEELERAYATARELDVIASAMGGWEAVQLIGDRPVQRGVASCSAPRLDEPEELQTLSDETST